MMAEQNDINAVDIGGNSALIRACKSRQGVNVVRKFIESGADVNMINLLGNSPLHWAVRKKSYLDVIKLLLKSGANINAKNSFHDSPLHNAAESENADRDVVQLLLDCGADVNMKGPGDLIPLHVHIRDRNCSYDITKLLIECGANLNRGGTNNDLLQLAVSNRSCGMNVIELLLFHGLNPDPNYHNMYKHPAVIKRFQTGDKNLDIAKLLIKYNLLLSLEFDLDSFICMFPYFNQKDILLLERCINVHVSELNEMKNEYIAQHITLWDFLVRSYDCKKAPIHIKCSQDYTWSILQLEKYPLYRDILLHNIPKQVIAQQMEEMYSFVNWKQDSGRITFDSICYLIKYLSKEDVLNLGLSFQVH